MKKSIKVNKNTKTLYAAYAIRGRAAALLAAYVAFDPIGAQAADIEELYDLACGICNELADNPSVGWDWLEAHRPKIPSASYRTAGAVISATSGGRYPLQKKAGLRTIMSRTCARTLITLPQKSNRKGVVNEIPQAD